MTKQEVLDKLDEIKGIVDTDFLNRHALEGVIDMINYLHFHLNANTEDFEWLLNFFPINIMYMDCYY